MLFISSIHIIAFCWSFSPLIFLGGTVLTFLKVQKVAPPPASVLLVATMLVPASLLLLLVKLARVHLVLMGVWWWGIIRGWGASSGGRARGWTNTPREGRKI